MKILTNEEMEKVNGGANSLLIVSVVAGLITLVTGILDGYSNPKKCNN
ncbi:MAG: class IIb bacteriocin, lactobin A/cerein 7B family [Bacilli bacterium]